MTIRQIRDQRTGTHERMELRQGQRKFFKSCGSCMYHQFNQCRRNTPSVHRSRLHHRPEFPAAFSRQDRRQHTTKFPRHFDEQHRRRKPATLSRIDGHRARQKEPAPGTIPNDRPQPHVVRQIRRHEYGRRFVVSHRLFVHGLQSDRIQARSLLDLWQTGNQRWEMTTGRNGESAATSSPVMAGNARTQEGRSRATAAPAN